MTNQSWQNNNKWNNREKTTICLSESRVLKHFRLLRLIRRLKLNIKPDVKMQCSQTQQAHKYVTTQRPRVWCQTPPAAVKTEKVIVVWQRCQKNVDKVKYSATCVRRRASLLGNLKGVLDPLVPGVTAGWRQRQGWRGGRRLWDNSRLLLLFFLFCFILLCFILLLRVSIISGEGGVRQQRGALILLDGLAERPQLAQQRHVELPQTDLVHDNTKRPGSDNRRGNFSVSVNNLRSRHDCWSTAVTPEHFWCGGKTLASGLWVNSCLNTGLFRDTKWQSHNFSLKSSELCCSVRKPTEKQTRGWASFKKGKR